MQYNVDAMIRFINLCTFQSCIHHCLSIESITFTHTMTNYNTINQCIYISFIIYPIIIHPSLYHYFAHINMFISQSFPFPSLYPYTMYLYISYLSIHIRSIHFNAIQSYQDQCHASCTILYVHSIYHQHIIVFNMYQHI